MANANHIENTTDYVESSDAILGLADGDALKLRLPPQFSRFENLAKAAVNYWSPTARLRIVRPLGGFSGAAVFKVDITTAQDSALKSGQYILKLYEDPEWPGEEGEKQRHLLAEQKHAEFATKHLPKLVASFREAREATNLSRTALLYEIAGQSLHSFITIDSALPRTLERVSAQLLRDLLDCWTDPEPSDVLTPRALLHDWLGYRLDPEQCPTLTDLVRSEYGDNTEIIVAHETLLNPLWLCVSHVLETTPDVYVSGLVHGDLQMGNVLVHRSDLDAPYWLIDLALCRRAPLGYDHAYLEVAQIIRELELV